MFEALISSGYSRIRPVAIKASGLLRLQFVAGQLLADEAIVRQIVVEGSNDVVAVSMGIGAQAVFFEAFGFAVAHQIEPVLCPTLAVARRGQQTVDHFGVGIGGLIGEEIGLFGRRRREAGEIEGHAAQQRELVGLGIGF